MRRSRGQSLVEVVTLAPLLVLCGLLGMQALAFGAAHVYADNAAHAGAVAAGLGGDPAAAAKRAVPGWARGRVDVRRSGRQLRVLLRPRAVLPAVAGLLSVESAVSIGGVARR
ncbi:MAG: hypothetical protein ACRDKI_05950 [Solirubrobacterales bacterium]